jgi:hypothetical protein
MNDSENQNQIIPAITTSNEIVVRQGQESLAPAQQTKALGPEEWERLDSLRKRIESEPYHVMLGLRSGTSPSEVQHRVTILNDWLESIEKRPGLNGEERAALAICKEQIPLAEWVLTDPELGPSYVAKVDARQENKGI